MDGAITLLNQQPLLRRGKNRAKVVNVMTDRLPLGEAAKLEMASFPTKTPVSVLQELLSQRGITPNYELVQIEGPVHMPIFRYRVFINNDVLATGTGRSKKEAKHAAAKSLLDILAGQQSSSPNGPASNGVVVPVSSVNLKNSTLAPYENKAAGNPIGWLQEMCMSRRWPPPFYDMEHEEGLPHERQFTIACTVLKFKEIGTGNSKKLAKHMAAQKMWQALQDIPEDASDTQGNSELDDELLAHMANIKVQGDKDNKNSYMQYAKMSQKISQLHKQMKNAVGSVVNELLQNPMGKPDFNPMEFLRDLAIEQLLEITFVDIEEKSSRGMFQCLVQISTMPIAVCFGTGNTAKEAQIAGAYHALDYLRLLMRR